MFTINEAREILNLPPVENGDKRLQTLNVVQADKVNQYQIGNGRNNAPVNKIGESKNGSAKQTGDDGK